MRTSVSTEFFYNAHGIAVTGEITRPVSRLIETTVSAALPVTGGATSAGAGKTVFSHPQLGNILSFNSASVQLAGSFNESDCTHNTLVTVTIEGLNVLDTVTANRLVLKLSARHDQQEEEGHIIPLGSSFEDLRIAGHPVEVELDHELFSECATYLGFRARYIEDAVFRKRVRKQFLWGDYDPGTPEFLKDRFKWHTMEDTPPESKGLVPCTLVKSVKHDQPNVLQTYGNVILVPQFGKIFLGEVILKKGTRQLTMLRVELGSPVGGSLVICGGGGNGNGWP